MDKRLQIYTLYKTIEWLSNLEEIVGTNQMMDACPNNYGGRTALRQLAEEMEKERANHAEDQP